MAVRALAVGDRFFRTTLTWRARGPATAAPTIQSVFHLRRPSPQRPRCPHSWRTRPDGGVSDRLLPDYLGGEGGREPLSSTRLLISTSMTGPTESKWVFSFYNIHKTLDSEPFFGTMQAATRSQGGKLCRVPQKRIIASRFMPL